MTVNTLARAENEVFLSGAGMFGGCSTCMESNSGYPKRYENTKTEPAKTKALSTNLRYYRGYVIAAEMAKLLGRGATAHTQKAADLKTTINSRLWLEEEGYYAYFEDETGQLQESMEGTSEAFAILWDVADAARPAHTP